MNDLDRNIRSYYGAKRLDPARVDAIESSIHRSHHLRRASRMVLAAAAAAVVVVATWLGQPPDADPTQHLIAEVVRNHLDSAPLLVESDRYDVVQRGLPELGFPIRPRRRVSASLDLAGGRYCSLLGARAAQLRMVDRETRVPHTLYVTPLSEDTATVVSGVFQLDRLQIEVWIGGDRLFALAGDH